MGDLGRKEEWVSRRKNKNGIQGHFAGIGLIVTARRSVRTAVIGVRSTATVMARRTAWKTIVNARNGLNQIRMILESERT